MFVNRKIYSRDIENIHFEGNETKGTISAFDSKKHLIKSWNTVAHNSAEFQSMTRKYYNEMNKNKLV